MLCGVGLHEHRRHAAPDDPHPPQLADRVTLATATMIPGGTLTTARYGHSATMLVGQVLVIGGYNSSNTLSLAALCSESVRTFHVQDADDIDPESGRIRHRPLGSKEEAESADWLPPKSPVRVGVTAGASTPNNKIGEAVGRIFATRGIDPKTVR